MWKSIVGLALASAFLFAADRGLAAREDAVRTGTRKVGRLVPFAERGLAEPEALEATVGHGGTHVYALTNGDWRCVTYRDAPANEELVKGVIQKLFRAEGIVISPNGERASQLGFADAPAAVLRVHRSKAARERGEKPIAVVEVGRTLDNGAGSFVRRGGERAIWSIDQSVLPDLAPTRGAPHLPPLLDPSLIPIAWLQRAHFPKAIRIERKGSPAFDLEIREKRVTQEELRQGKLPYDWVVVSPSGERICDPGLSNSYTTFLLRAPYADVIDPKRIPELGFDAFEARVTIVPRTGTELQLVVKPSQTAGRSLVWNTASGSAFEVPSDFARLLTPSEDQLATEGASDPWRPFSQNR